MVATETLVAAHIALSILLLSLMLLKGSPTWVPYIIGCITKRRVAFGVWWKTIRQSAPDPFVRPTSSTLTSLTPSPPPAATSSPTLLVTDSVSLSEVKNNNNDDHECLDLNSSISPPTTSTLPALPKDSIQDERATPATTMMFSVLPAQPTPPPLGVTAAAIPLRTSTNDVTMTKTPAPIVAHQKPLYIEPAVIRLPETPGGIIPPASIFGPSSSFSEATAPYRLVRKEIGRRGDDGIFVCDSTLDLTNHGDDGSNSSSAAVAAPSSILVSPPPPLNDSSSNQPTTEIHHYVRDRNITVHHHVPPQQDVSSSSQDSYYHHPQSAEIFSRSIPFVPPITSPIVYSAASDEKVIPTTTRCHPLPSPIGTSRPVVQVADDDVVPAMTAAATPNDNYMYSPPFITTAAFSTTPAIAPYLLGQQPTRLQTSLIQPVAAYNRSAHYNDRSLFVHAPSSLQNLRRQPALGQLKHTL